MHSIVGNVAIALKMSNFLVSIIGPTAIGKTSLSLTLADHFNTSIISADSRQFFKEMSIGTAVPSKKEQAKVNHYFIQHRSIDEPYDVGAFEKDALLKLSELFKSNRIVIMVGGSGLYIDAVMNGLNEFPKVNEDTRESLNKVYDIEGIQTLQNKLKELDPLSYNTLDLNNPHRVIRALEVSLSSGRPFSSFLNKPKRKRNFKTICIGLTADRNIIYSRINERVEKMMEAGLLEEAKSLFHKRNLNALNTVGYKELFKYLEGEWSLEFAISEIKKNTRRFAKRQITWFKKNELIKWFDHSTSTAEIIDYVNQEMSRRENL